MRLNLLFFPVIVKRFWDKIATIWKAVFPNGIMDSLQLNFFIIFPKSIRKQIVLGVNVRGDTTIHTFGLKSLSSLSTSLQTVPFMHSISNYCCY